MSLPTVSVIMATYNRSNIIGYAIGSLLRSSFADWELIVVGDACTDDTESVVSSFADPRIRFIKVDAEGFDLAILQTLDGIIRERRPYLQVEMFALRKSPPSYRRALFDFLVSHGYAVHRIDGPHDILGEAITADNLARWETYDVLCVPAGATLARSS